MIGGAVNVGLNLLLVKLLGSYFVASVTTFLGFFVYFLLAVFGTRKHLIWHIKAKSLFNILLSAAVMAGVIKLIEHVLPDGKLYLALFVFCGIIVYGLMLTITGEVRDEISIIKNRLLRK